MRTDRYKYIRNFYWHVPHAQPSRYKDGKDIMKIMRRLYAQGKLDDNQARPFIAPRPVEELYDIKADPHELTNLAGYRKYAAVLKELRGRLAEWVEDTRDIGQLPEPIIADFLKKYDTPYAILEDSANRRLARQINQVWDVAQRGKDAVAELVRKMRDKRPQVRYAAAFWLGNIGVDTAAAKDVLVSGLTDDADYVRVACARAVCLIGDKADSKALAVLVKELQQSDNEVVRHHAAAALEDIGPKAKVALGVIKQARTQKYEYVKRVTTRTAAALDAD